MVGIDVEQIVFAVMVIGLVAAVLVGLLFGFELLEKVGSSLELFRTDVTFLYFGESRWLHQMNENLTIKEGESNL